MLNAAPALPDLFRLIDHQNSPGERELSLRGHVATDGLDVCYPTHSVIRLRPGMVQTGFLFPQPADADRNELYRSICSLAAALIGAEGGPDDPNPGNPGEPFTEWVNAGSFRHAPADDGIGNRGVSTAHVAALTSPFADVAEIISGRLLREAIKQLSSPDGTTESNREYAEQFLAAAGLTAILADDSVPFDEPVPVHGAREVTAALRDRASAMRNRLGVLKAETGA
jgi:hypothetical protein